MRTAVQAAAKSKARSSANGLTTYPPFRTISVVWPNQSELAQRVGLLTTLNSVSSDDRAVISLK